MDIPTPNDVIAFVVFFFPGFITFWLVSELCGVSIKQRSDLEKIVLSSIFSIFSFLTAGISLQVENITMAIFNFSQISYVFAVSVILAIVLWILIRLWNYVDATISVKLQKFWSRLLPTYSGNESGFSYMLRHIYDAKDKNQLIIHTKSGEVYKGSLGGYSPNTLEIIIIGTEESPIMQLKAGHWEEIDEYLIYFNGKDINRIAAIGFPSGKIE